MRPTGRSGICDQSVSQIIAEKKNANKVPTSSSISMEWYVNTIELHKRISSRSLPVGMGVARVRERIERAKMARREIENFIVVSTLFSVGY